MLLRAVLHAALSLASVVFANVEKVIFVAPSPSETPAIASFLQLDVLSHHGPSLRKQLQLAFPTAQSPNGLPSWYLLDALVPGQRYEVRVCWAATQPTAFWLHEYTLGHVFDSSSLTASIAEFAEESQDSDGSNESGTNQATESLDTRGHIPTASRLLLQIFAAADFYTTNQSLMNFPPPVHVEIILDPYILNILPRSLLPTAAYILLLVVGSWYLSDYIWKWLRDISQANKKSEDSIRQQTEKLHSE